MPLDEYETPRYFDDGTTLQASYRLRVTYDLYSIFVGLRSYKRTDGRTDGSPHKRTDGRTDCSPHARPVSCWLFV